MKKRILQQFIVTVLSLGYLVGICLMEGMSWGLLADCMTFLALAIWAYVLLDDFFAKVIWYRYAITKQYLIYEGLYALSLTAMTGSFLSHNFYLTIATMIGSILLFASALAYHVVCFKDKSYVSFETERAKWFILLDRLEDFETKEELQEKLYHFLRFSPKRDVLKASLDISRPLDTTGANRTVAEMLADDATDEDAFKAQAYIRTLVDSYWEVARKEEGKK